MRKITLLILCSLLLVLPGGLSAQSSTAAECTPAQGDPLRIGVVLPGSSLISVRSDHPLEGVVALTAAINDCGGVNGRPVELVISAAADREGANEAVDELMQGAGVPLIIGSGNPAVHETLTQRAQTGEFILWEVTQALNTPVDWAFSALPNDTQLGAAAVTFMQRNLEATLGLTNPAVAIVHDGTPRGLRRSEGMRAALTGLPLIDFNYGTDTLSSAYQRAVEMRESAVDVLLFSGFYADSDRLWYAAREANANLSAWIHVGTEADRRDLCERIGDSEGLITVSAAGVVSSDYRTTVTNGLYDEFRQTYVRQNTSEPSLPAQLSAAGAYLLLAHVLPAVDGPYTPENVRTAILSMDVPPESGFMGEGLRFAEDGLNAYTTPVIQQRQAGAFCSVWPEAIATCALPTVPMPSWRERVIMAENITCRDGT